MKFLIIAAGILLVSLLNFGLYAGQVYTWTDKDGNLHVTDTPPPPKSNLKDTLEYEERTAAEIQELKNRKKLRVEESAQEEKINKVEEAKRRARQADERAKKAVEQAEQITSDAESYIRRLSSTKEKRKQFRKKIQREAARAQAAQANARKAIEDANQAAEDARQPLAFSVFPQFSLSYPTAAVSAYAISVQSLGLHAR
jgi:chemotaxis protein histidine kinase CheA